MLNNRAVLFSLVLVYSMLAVPMDMPPHRLVVHADKMLVFGVNCRLAMLVGTRTQRYYSWICMWRLLLLALVFCMFDRQPDWCAPIWRWMCLCWWWRCWCGPECGRCFDTSQSNETMDTCHSCCTMDCQPHTDSSRQRCHWDWLSGENAENENVLGLDI